MSKIGKNHRFETKNMKNVALIKIDYRFSYRRFNRDVLYVAEVQWVLPHVFWCACAYLRM